MRNIHDITHFMHTHLFFPPRNEKSNGPMIRQSGDTIYPYKKTIIRIQGGIVLFL